jgi:hypothetical protein
MEKIDTVSITADLTAIGLEEFERMVKWVREKHPDARLVHSFPEQVKGLLSKRENARKTKTKVKIDFSKESDSPDDPTRVGQVLERHFPMGRQFPGELKGRQPYFSNTYGVAFRATMTNYMRQTGGTAYFVSPFDSSPDCLDEFSRLEAAGVKVQVIVPGLIPQ